MRRRVLVAALVLASSATGQVPHEGGALPSFEVATVRPWKPSQPPPSQQRVMPQRVMKESPVGGEEPVTERVHFIGQVELLIADAYHLPVDSRERILGGPDWLRQESERYEIQAKIDPVLYASMGKMTVPEQRRQVEEMEQSLLADRFGLKVHSETRELPVYALVTGKGGTKLRPAKGGSFSKLSSQSSERGVELTATAVTLQELVRSPLMKTDRASVVDHTGLTGRYDLSLRWLADDLGPPASGQAVEGQFPSLFTALSEQLGLKLIPSKAPVEVIVIDRVQRPAAN